VPKGRVLNALSLPKFREYLKGRKAPTKK
jgi:hypothetical protein